jgi:hypothetical protein
VTNVSTINVGVTSAADFFSDNGKTGSDGSASFADLLANANDEAAGLTPAEIRQRDRDHLLQRITEVGFARAIQEEQEKQKMLRVLSMMEATAPADVRAQLSDLAADFKRHPPNGIEDMYARIQTVIDSIPNNAPNHLKDRMIDAFRRIRDLMSLAPDPRVT